MLVRPGNGYKSGGGWNLSAENDEGEGKKRNQALFPGRTKRSCPRQE